MEVNISNKELGAQENRVYKKKEPSMEKAQCFGAGSWRFSDLTTLHESSSFIGDEEGFHCLVIDKHHYTLPAQIDKLNRTLIKDKLESYIGANSGIRSSNILRRDIYDPIFGSHPLSRAMEITINGSLVDTLPRTLIDLYGEIEESKYILSHIQELENGSLENYSVETWSSAIKFIVRHAKWILDNLNKRMAVPKIYHGPSSSIDIYWESDAYNLLINIPPQGMATFYGDDYKDQRIKGQFNPESLNHSLLPTLITI